MQNKIFKFQNLESSYHFINDNERDGIALVCCGGLGGTHLIWSPFVRALRAKYPILIWNYPGLAPGESLSEDVSVQVPALATYLDRLIQSENLKRVFLVGWSLGVQVSVEYSANRADIVRGLAAVCGAAGKPFEDKASSDPLRTVLGVKRSSWPHAINWLSERLDRIDRLRSLLRGIDSPTRWAKRLGLVDPLIDDLVFDAVVRDFLDLDVAVYNRYAQAAAEHDASLHLPNIAFPVLVVSGERDAFARPKRLKAMAGKIQNGEYFEVRGATHYLPLEYGPLLALKIDDFLIRQGIS